MALYEYVLNLVFRRGLIPVTSLKSVSSVSPFFNNLVEKKITMYRFFISWKRNVKKMTRRRLIFHSSNRIHDDDSSILLF